MKTIKLALIITLVAIASISKAQTYGKLTYWGKDYRLDRNFIQILNNNYSTFMESTAPTWRYYDFKDYQDLYAVMVGHITKPNFVIIVTEANRLQYQSDSILPGSSLEKDRSKKSTARANWLWDYVVKPSLQQFVQNQ